MVGWLFSSNKWNTTCDLIMNFYSTEYLYLIRHGGDSIILGYEKRLMISGVAKIIDARKQQST